MSNTTAPTPSASLIATIRKVREVLGHIGHPVPNQVPVVGGHPVTIAEFRSPDSQIKYRARIDAAERVTLGPVPGSDHSSDGRPASPYDLRLVFNLRRRGINAHQEG